MPGLLIYSAPQIKKKSHLLGCMLKMLESFLLATLRYIMWFLLAVHILFNRNSDDSSGFTGICTLWFSVHILSSSGLWGIALFRVHKWKTRFKNTSHLVPSETHYDLWLKTRLFLHNECFPESYSFSFCGTDCWINKRPHSSAFLLLESLLKTFPPP